MAFALGEVVRIIDGPFLDFTGRINEVDINRSQLKVMVLYFGREQVVELDFLQVKKL